MGSFNDHVAAMSTTGGINDKLIAWAAGAPVMGSVVVAEVPPLAAPAASFDFTSIPADYRHLMVVGYVRTDAVAALDNLYVALNGDTVDANYDQQYLLTTGAGASAGEFLAAAPSRWIGYAAGATATADHYGMFVLTIPNYIGADRKGVIGHDRIATSRASGGLYMVDTYVHWANTAVVNRVTITPATGPNFVAGSTINVYGKA